jgi:hypothetical protein
MLNRGCAPWVAAHEPSEVAMADLSEIEGASPEAPERVQARKRVERKRKFWGDFVAYFVINAFLIGVWAVDGFGYFWPGWVLSGWGVFLMLDVWNVFFRPPVTEDDIERELRSRR